MLFVRHSIFYGTFVYLLVITLCNTVLICFRVFKVFVAYRIHHCWRETMMMMVLVSSIHSVDDIDITHTTIYGK